VTAYPIVLPTWWSCVVACRWSVLLHHQPIRYSLLYHVMYFVFVIIHCFVYGCHCCRWCWHYLNSLHVVNREWWVTLNLNVFRKYFSEICDICLYRGRGICHKVAGECGGRISMWHTAAWTRISETLMFEICEGVNCHVHCWISDAMR